jgi:hypothetical protein
MPGRTEDPPRGEYWLAPAIPQPGVAESVRATLSPSGVPVRARSLLGSDCKILYMVRNPLDRIVSQYRHEYAEGQMSLPIDEAVRRDERFISFSSYAMQLDPWKREFGRDHLHIVHFESYVRSRAETVARIASFLGVSASSWRLPRSTVVYNRSDAHPFITPGWSRFGDSQIYKLVVRPLISVERRTRLRSVLLPKAAVAPVHLRQKTIEFIWDRLASDVERFHREYPLDVPSWPRVP